MSEAQEQPAQPPLPGPGPSLDRLVAAKLGYEWLILPGAFGPVGRWVKPGTQDSAYDMMWRHETGRDQPQYSTDIGAAWEIIEFMRSKGYQFSMFDRTGNEWGTWLIRFQYAASFDVTRQSVQWAADTAPLGICLAFLALPDLGEVQE